MLTIASKEDLDKIGRLSGNTLYLSVGGTIKIVADLVLPYTLKFRACTVLLGVGKKKPRVTFTNDNSPAFSTGSACISVGIVNLDIKAKRLLGVKRNQLRRFELNRCVLDCEELGEASPSSLLLLWCTVPGEETKPLNLIDLNSVLVIGGSNNSKYPTFDLGGRGSLRDTLHVHDHQVSGGLISIGVSEPESSNVIEYGQLPNKCITITGKRAPSNVPYVLVNLAGEYAPARRHISQRYCSVN